ncbi:hypothetical protein ACQ259_15810 [Stutzerimonas stutzeri]|uniref:hypothetical protein n=1 Tax=Stutzerimonas stutzeri subgroup TaxID=578833 RepID=UPI0011B04006|nr:hypothetical protein [Stutzerimonas kunmingensis]
MNMTIVAFGAFSIFTFTLSANAEATDVNKLRACTEKQARAVGYHVAGLDGYGGNYLDIRLAQSAGSEVSVRDIVAADEARGGGMYDMLVSMRDSIKLCAGFYGLLDISDFDGAAIVKDR